MAEPWKRSVPLFIQRWAGAVAAFLGADNVFSGSNTFQKSLTLVEDSLTPTSQTFTADMDGAPRQLADCSSFVSGSVTLAAVSNPSAGKTVTLYMKAAAVDLPVVYNASWNQLDASAGTLLAGEDMEVTFYCRGNTQADVWYKVTRAAGGSSSGDAVYSEFNIMLGDSSTEDVRLVVTDADGNTVTAT